MMLPNQSGGYAGHIPVANDIDKHDVRKQIDEFFRIEGIYAWKRSFAALAAPERVEASEERISQITRL